MIDALRDKRIAVLMGGLSAERDISLSDMAIVRQYLPTYVVISRGEVRASAGEIET